MVSTFSINMIKVLSNIVPIKGYKAMAIYPFLFIRKDELKSFSRVSMRHEMIHFKQQLQLLIIPFYILYLVFWVIYGYRNIPFEREAYSNEDNVNYKVQLWSWTRYFK